MVTNKHPKFTLCTVTYNRSDLFTEYATKVIPWIVAGGGEWIIVDNNSSDTIKQVLKSIDRLYPNLLVTVLLLPENRGMGYGYNQAVNLASSENIIFSSYDINVYGDFISPLVDYIEKDSNVLVGPRLITFPAGWNEFESVAIVPYVEGFMLAINRTRFNEIGKWDENIFLDYEDVELSFRAREGGIALAQINLPVVHMGGQSFSTLSRVRLEITKESMKYFCKKWNLVPKNQMQKEML